ncbi:hypothetical protein D3C73_1321630 [compost metagenome]
MLYNPFTIISIVTFLICIWKDFKNYNLNILACSSSLILIIFIEIATFLLWHFKTITGKLDISLSLKLAYPEFYLGLLVSMLMLLTYLFIAFLVLNKKNVKS